MHETERNLQLIAHIIGQENACVKLYPGLKEDAKTSQYKTVSYICVAPASLWFTKQYPVEKWVEFLNVLDNDLRVYLIGSPLDQDLSNQIIRQSTNKNMLNLCGSLSILETASLMQDARMNFVNDSAPQHLASSVNAPVSSIFCSTIPAFGFGPLSDNAAVIETDEKLSCRPCGLHGLRRCPENHFKCATTIKKEQLLLRL